MWSRGLGSKFNFMGGGVNKQSEGDVNLFNERVNGDTSARRRDENFYETKQVVFDFMCFRLCNF